MPRCLRWRPLGGFDPRPQRFGRRPRRRYHRPGRVRALRLATDPDDEDLPRAVGRIEAGEEDGAATICGLERVGTNQIGSNRNHVVLMLDWSDATPPTPPGSVPR